MSEHEPIVESAEPDASLPTPSRRRGIAAALALILALLAVAGVVAGGWYLWQLERGRSAGSAALQSMQTRLDTMDQQVQQLGDQRKTLHQRLSDAEDVNRSLREQLVGLSERTRNLEDAVANLSRRTLSGHDALLLDEAELMLRLGQARYTLFHDGAGADAALAQADQALASVEDPAFAGVRQTIEGERKALAASHPERRQAELDTLASLREQAAAWPLRSVGEKAAAAPHGFWARAWHAVSGLVHVSRDADAPLALADGRLARELVQLDLAQAQAALLAGNSDGFRAALGRADAALSHYFDADAAAVQAAHAQFTTWLKQDTSPAPELGRALQELRNLRQVRQAKPAAASSSAAGAQR